MSSSGDLSKQAEARLAQLRQRYLSSLADKASAFESALHQCRTNDWSSETVEALNIQAHRLAGSAGSYGLSEIQNAAMDLDQATQHKVIEKGQARGEVSTMIQTLVKMLHQVSHEL